MPNTGNKCIDLYELSKNLQKIKKPTDKNTIDYEFEKGREQCTFKPLTNARSPKADKRQNTSIKDMRGAQKSIERMQKARQRLEEIKFFNQTGKLLS